MMWSSQIGSQKILTPNLPAHEIAVIKMALADGQAPNGGPGVVWFANCGVRFAKCGGFGRCERGNGFYKIIVSEQ